MEMKYGGLLLEEYFSKSFSLMDRFFEWRLAVGIRIFVGK